MFDDAQGFAAAWILGGHVGEEPEVLLAELPCGESQHLSGLFPKRDHPVRSSR